MNPLDLVRLTALMQRTSGRPEIKVGLLDGPVATNHPDLAGQTIREVPGAVRGTCARASSAACMHGTFVAGILSAKQGAPAPAICPGCTLLVRPVFSESTLLNGRLPSATPTELAAAILASIEAGARVLNLSVALEQPSASGQRELEEALNHAGARGVIVVAAAGNQATVGSSIITRHPWVVPVIACDRQGRPMDLSNLGRSIGRGGLSAPGDRITSLGTDGQPVTSSGTSVAAPYVTGAVALLWSEFPDAKAAEVKYALTRTHASPRRAVVPPLLDAWGAYQTMTRKRARMRMG
jgi:subtilisin family serine protease